MKLKYYLRGLGIGIIVTTVILAISFGGKKADIDDIPVEEVIAKATMLGMVMPEDTETPATEQQDGTEAAFGDGAENSDIPSEDSATQPDNAGTAPSEDESSDTPQDTADTTDTPEDTADNNSADTSEDTDADNKTTDTGNQEETKPPYRLVVNRGDVCRTICENLAANGLIEDAEAFRKYLQEIGYASFISVGNYDIPYGLTQEEIAAILKNGPIEEQQ